MVTSKNSHYFYSLDSLLEKKIKYILSIGKRQPMHIGHKNSLDRILAINGIKLIYVIGSSNLKGDPLFDPLTNPLTIEQQIKQFQIAFPKDNPIFIAIPDIPQMNLWGEVIISELQKLNIKPSECAIHFIGKQEDKLKEDVSFILENGKKYSLEKGRWLIEALTCWGFYLWFDNIKEVDLTISARNLRKLDLESLSEEHHKILATPSYLKEIAIKAREENLEKDKLKNSPITLYDLTLKRVQE